MKMINFEKKKMAPLPNKQREWYKRTNICHICKEKFEHKYTNDKNYR